MITIARLYIEDQQRRFASISQRLQEVLGRFNDKEVNWRPNQASNSVANLVMHICGNIGQRFGHLINQKPDTRNRPAEFDTKLKKTVPELVQLLQEGFAEIDEILARMPLAMLYHLVQAGENQITIHELISSCAAHYSEHLGQVLYLGKMRPFAAKKRPVAKPKARKAR
jgi:hypothetical protein